jgi:amino acid adenylation domain-containing protein
MLFQSLYAPQSGVYCVQLSCLLRGDFDVRAFVRSWQQVLERHTILRTAFFWEEISKPLQVVHRRVALPLEEQDWRGLSTTEQASRFEALLESDRTRGFELSTAPLMRLALIRTADDSHRLLWSFHHLLLDGWSVYLLFKELFVLYDASIQGRRLQLEPVRPFRDYIAWLQQQDLSRAEDFWRASLKGFSAPTSLSPEMNSAAMRAGRSYGEQRFNFSENTTNALRLLARRHRLTLNTLIQGAWALLLSRYSGEHDVVFGVTAAGRPTDLREADSMIGLFINTLPARVQIADAEPAVSWLQHLQEQQAEQRHYEYTPLAQVQRWREGARGESLFESIVVFENYPVDDAVRERSSEHDLQIAEMRFHEQTEYPLTVVVAPGKELTLGLGYDSSRFSPSAIERMGGHLGVLLEGVLSNPEGRIADLPLLTDKEQHRLLYEWNQTEKDYPAELIHELFEAQAERTPEAVAVVFEEEEVSYRELNERANQLAHHLRRVGVGAETLVGVLMERSLEMVVSLLAVLKAGGAYVPLDPEYPKARVSFMLADAGVSVVLTQARLLGMVESGGARVVSVDREWEVIGEQSKVNPARTTSPENLAYVIYTSGSTGTPNGVLVQHNSVANLIQQARSIFQVDSHSRVLHVASFSFDASVLELFLALGSGASLYLCSSAQRLSPDEVSAVVRSRQLTTAVLTPSLLKVLDREQCRSLRTISSGGERLTADVAERWSRAARRLLNCYGPTEVTIFGTYAKCDPMGDPAASTAPAREPTIGRGLENVSVYVLDAAMEVVPVGVIGELYIGGAGVARGYLGRADLTAERFVPDPYSVVAGARMYRTGDDAKWRRGGELEYVGRRDEQVKIRGQRLELAEVEATLRKQEGVRECAVVLRDGTNGEQRLLAYVVADKALSLKPENESTGKSGGLSERPELCPSVAEYFVYDDYLYDTLSHDEKRNNKYRAVINRNVRNKVVLDVGTGPDAILARLCVEGGAKRVYAIEVLEQTYRQAVATIKSLGLEDRIILIHGDSMQVQLPEKVDVCVSEIVGSIGGSEGAAPIINNAHRWLKPDGVMIPERSRTRVAAASLPDELLKNPGFSEMSANYVARIFEQVGHPFDLRLCIRNFPESHLISEAEIFEDLNFTEQVATEYRREVHLRITRKGKLDGLLVWLNLQLGEGTVIDILEPGYSWFPIYFPVFYPGVEVDEGDAIVAVCSGRPSDNGINPDYRIEGKLVRRGGSEIEFDYQSGHHKTRYRHEAFYRLIFDEDGAIRKREQTEVTGKRLRTELKKHLPDYMVPQSFLILDELPLTPSGKIDRKALPAPETIRFEMERPHIAPRTLLEQRLADIWSHLLGIQQISIHDSFFDLGGHSLLSTRLISQLRKTFAIEMSLRRFFEIPTVAMLAVEIEKLNKGDAGIEETVIKSLPRESRRMKRSSLER